VLEKATMLTDFAGIQPLITFQAAENKQFDFCLERNHTNK
jgi:hypothetical protein